MVDSPSTADRPAFQVLERTFGILEVFTESRPEWSTTQVARELDLPVPTTHRILAALKRLGYVSQDGQTRLFRLGLAALSLGERARTWPTFARWRLVRCVSCPRRPARRPC